MDNLLLNDFTIEHRKQKGAVPTNSIVKSTNFYLNDDKPCDDENNPCPLFFKNPCKRDTFKVKVDTPVTIINIESFINSFKIKGSRCDYILYDASKIVLADLTCTMDYYLYPHTRDGEMVQGKRIKARDQIEHTLEILCAVKSIRDYISKKRQKVGVLAYKVKDGDLFQNVPIQIDRTLAIWLNMEKEIEMRNISFPMLYGFKFEMVKYPNEYIW